MAPTGRYDLAMSDVAERIRSTLLEAALEAYEDAGLRGLCAEGRWEAAVSALRSVDLRKAIEPPSLPGGVGPR